MKNKKNKIDLLKKFATPIWVSPLDNVSKINIDLLKYIYDLRKKDPKGIKRSNMLGWHSNNIDITKSQPHQNFFNKISSNLAQVAKDMSWNKTRHHYKITNTWAIINPPLACNQSHIHSNNLISAAYYVKFPKNGGRFIAEDPRETSLYYHPVCDKVNSLNEQNVAIEPKTGLLVMFPSYVKHWVEPNLSKEDRVIISFNIDKFSKYNDFK
ncbi:MAG: hypothetical protein HOF83_07615 [Pelagibacteraceae bacterium]|nr:hypothetical protein [Pelagibacteraceae bacterium]